MYLVAQASGGDGRQGARQAAGQAPRPRKASPWRSTSTRSSTSSSGPTGRTRAPGTRRPRSLVLLAVLVGIPVGGLLRDYAGPDRRSSRPAAPRRSSSRRSTSTRRARRSTSTCTASSCARSTAVRRAAAPAAEQGRDGRAARRHQPGRPRPRPAVRAVQAGAAGDRCASSTPSCRSQVKVTGSYHDMGAFASDIGQLLAHRDAERRRRSTAGKDGKLTHGRHRADLPLPRRRGSGAAAQGAAAAPRRAANEMKHRLVLRAAVAVALAALRRRRAQRPQAGARRSSPRTSAASVDAAAAGEALRAGPLHRRGPDRPVPPAAHRGRRSASSARAASKLALEQETRPAQGAAQAFPLESIQMVGTITQDKETFALVKAGPNLYQVQQGQLHRPELRRRSPGSTRVRSTSRSWCRTAAANGSSATARCNWWRQKDEQQRSQSLCSLRSALSLCAGIGAARRRQANAIEGVRASRSRAARPWSRITTKEPLRSVPPNFAVANPARIAFDFPNTANGLGRSSQDISQGELRSMNVVQGARAHAPGAQPRRPCRTRPRSTGAAWSSRCRRRRWRRPRPAARCRASPRAAPTPSTQIRDVDFRRGRDGEGRVVVDLPTPPPASTSASRARTSSSTS